jgi:hypothetical protein
MNRHMKWRERVSLAADAESINAVMRDYVEAIAPAAPRLPARCQEALDRHVDLQSAAVTLLQEELRFEGPEDVSVLLREIAYTFAAASVRLTLIYGKPVVPPAPASQSRA